MSKYERKPDKCGWPWQLTLNYMIIDGKEYNDVEVAWAAGLFEGEGCIYANRATGVCIQIAMTDADVLQKFCDILGVGKVTTIARPKSFKAFYKTCYRWRIASKKDCQLVYKLFMPYLGIRRRTKFEELSNRLKNCNIGRKWGKKAAALHKNFAVDVV